MSDGEITPSPVALEFAPLRVMTYTGARLPRHTLGSGVDAPPVRIEEKQSPVGKTNPR